VIYLFVKIVVKSYINNYGGRGLLATPNQKYHYETFNTEEERNNFERDELPENAYDIDRWNHIANILV
jgi:hypothetical protein